MGERLEELKGLYRQAQESLAEVDADKRATLIRESRYLLAEIEELEAASPADVPANPLDELRAKRANRSA